jgi:hypothetical protein
MGWIGRLRHTKTVDLFVKGVHLTFWQHHPWKPFVLKNGCRSVKIRHNLTKKLQHDTNYDLKKVTQLQFTHK